jgi:ribosomal protein L7/L12
MLNCPFCKTPIADGAVSCPSCRAPISSTEAKDLEQQIRTQLAQGKKIEAVKAYRAQTGCTLKQAKDAVEAFEHGLPPPDPPEKGTALEADVLRLLRSGNKAKAVKLYHDRTGANLLDAKQAVESIASRHAMVVPGSTWRSVVLVMIVLTLAAMAVVAAMILRQ